MVIEADGDMELAPDQWEGWFDRHQAGLMVFARLLVATREEAQDAVQEGFVKFWKSRRKAQDVTAYLFGCVRSAAIDLRRARTSRQRHERASAEEPVLVGPPELDDRRALLEAALARLPREQREVLVLKTWSGLTFAQIAEVLGISGNTAASRYRYAVAGLQVILSPEVFHEG